MIRFESEQAFEAAFFKDVKDKMVNPINGLKVIDGVRQPDFGDHGRADILILETWNYPHAGSEQIAKQLHLIELKINQLSFPDIGQICRYKDFIIESGMMEQLGVETLLCSLITQKSDPSPNMKLLAKAAGIELYFFEMSFDGVTFDSYECFDFDMSKMKLAMEQITRSIEVN